MRERGIDAGAGALRLGMGSVGSLAVQCGREQTPPRSRLASARIDHRFAMRGLARASKQGRGDSNSQPPVLETGAPPVELRP